MIFFITFGPGIQDTVKCIPFFFLNLVLCFGQTPKLEATYEVIYKDLLKVFSIIMLKKIVWFRICLQLQFTLTISEIKIKKPYLTSLFYYREWHLDSLLLTL